MTAIPTSRQLAIVQRAASLIDGGCVVIDFETTGFPSDPRVGIVEVAAIDSRGSVLINTLVNPESAIPAGASKVHGITDQDVANAPTFADIFPDLARILENSRAVAYNYTFEKGMIAAVCKRYELCAPPLEWSCAMRADSVYKGLRYFKSLSNACKDEGITVETAHRALADVKMTLALLYTMAAGG